jgi:hypothetical protein
MSHSIGYNTLHHHHCNLGSHFHNNTGFTLGQSFNETVLSTHNHQQLLLPSRISHIIQHWLWLWIWRECLTPLHILLVPLQRHQTPTAALLTQMEQETVSKKWVFIPYWQSW